MEGTQLIHLNQARQALALAKSINEVKNIRDKAEALRAYAKQAGMTLEMQNECAEIKLRAERRAGEMLVEMVRPGNPQFFHDERIVSLKDLAIGESQSHRWQLEATIPEGLFEQYIAEIKRRWGFLPIHYSYCIGKMAYIFEHKGGKARHG